jgi:hypothetical protein
MVIVLEMRTKMIRRSNHGESIGRGRGRSDEIDNSGFDIEHEFVEA